MTESIQSRNFQQFYVTCNGKSARLERTTGLRDYDFSASLLIIRTTEHMCCLPYICGVVFNSNADTSLKHVQVSSCVRVIVRTLSAHTLSSKSKQRHIVLDVVIEFPEQRRHRARNRIQNGRHRRCHALVVLRSSFKHIMFDDGVLCQRFTGKSFSPLRHLFGTRAIPPNPKRAPSAVPCPRRVVKTCT